MNRRIALVSAAIALALPAAALGAHVPGAGNGYDPVVDPASFVRKVDNPYFPLRPGTKFVYEGMTEDGPERNVVFVTRKTRTILGIEAVVVRDTVWVDGEAVELTFDWYAQDKDGNVWYLGEDSRDFEDGKWVRSDGSWEAGVDGAEPGVVMWGDPLAKKGQSYRQEFFAGHAEDLASVLRKRSRPLEVPVGVFRQALVTKEWTPLEPGVAEQKIYAWGLGLIKAQQTKGGSEVIELVTVSGPRTAG